ncbi:MAG: c-type cytochrome [Flavobacteriales bacterium]
MRKTSALMRLTESLNQRLLLTIVLLLSLNFNSVASIFEGGDAAKGEALYIANCSSCHKTTDEVLAAPGLAGIEQRWAGKDALIVKWIQNPQAAAATGDPYIKGLVDKYVPLYKWMTAQTLTEAEIKDVLTYVKTAKPPVPPGGEVNKCMTLEDMQKLEDIEKEKGGNSATWFIIIGLILAIIAVSAANISKSLKNAMNERDGLPAVQEQSYWAAAKNWLWNNKKFVTVASLFVFCYFFVVGYVWLMDIGVYSVDKGYTPEQPIWFSHSIHNCQNEIDCQYCHSSASKSRHAGIPSVNVCMNCHKGIKKGTITGDKEISKIYEAIGFDPKTGAYIEGYEQKPIVWNKVHNLPDHVYFNHSQHVSVGKIDCKNCHGPQNLYTVGHMPTAEQINMQEDVTGLIKLEKDPFTMGWCLECHNKSGIDFKSSDYYTEMHSRYTKTGLGQRTLREIMDDGEATVRELGGWECGKCHY